VQVDIGHKQGAICRSACDIGSDTMNINCFVVDATVAIRTWSRNSMQKAFLMAGVG
jgi:hypothetical protein